MAKYLVYKKFGRNRLNGYLNKTNIDGNTRTSIGDIMYAYKFDTEKEAEEERIKIQNRNNDRFYIKKIS